MKVSATVALVCLLAASSGTGWAQTEPRPPAAAPAPEPAPLVLHFDLGSAAVRPQDEAVLDQASRAYREGSPIVMILTGSTDAVGSPEGNLRISQLRTTSVLRRLVARGIPAERFQLLAKGETDPAVKSQPDGVQPENRRVEIRWR